MVYLLAANAVLLAHLAFIFLVMFGGLIALRRPRFAMLHIPAAIWGAMVEAMGWHCPLTDLENALLHRAGDAGYAEGFVQRYLLAVIYPDGLTRDTQMWLAAAVVLINTTLYGWILVRRAKRKQSGLQESQDRTR